MSQKDLNIKNYMEEVIYGSMDDILKDLNVCTCEKCKMDIAAIALNQLPAKYIVTEKGELYSKINTLRQQFEVDIISAITRAVVLVKRSPRHE